MINARMGAEEKMVIQEIMRDLREIWDMIDHDPGPHRGGITGAGMETDFLRGGKAGDLWDAHVIIRKAKIKQQMISQSHSGHHPDNHERRWAVDDRGGGVGAQEPQPAVYNEWPRRYR